MIIGILVEERNTENHKKTGLKNSKSLNLGKGLKKALDKGF